MGPGWVGFLRRAAGSEGEGAGLWGHEELGQEVHFLHHFPPGVVLPHTILHALGESPSVWEPVLRPATLASLLGKLQLAL